MGKPAETDDLRLGGAAGFGQANHQFTLQACHIALVQGFHRWASLLKATTVTQLRHLLSASPTAMVDHPPATA
ncbi:hypothetical protein PPUN110474_50650 [Pseudomonas putida]|nr:hypothetical protein PPUN110474_50650 [Pseudomonas putida]